MREILFRGKRVDNGEWVEGELLHDMKGRPWIYWTTPKELPIFFLRSAIVKSETVGQFTGLYDKNGKRIFEGDIVELEDRYYDIKWRAVVEFGNPNGNYSWGWQLSHLGKVDINTDILCWVEMEEAGAFCEVIGNIHDNPELLAESDKRE